MSSPSRLRGALSCVLVLSIVAVCSVLVTPTSAQAQNALPFDRSYLVTGNYAVVGVDLLPQASDCTTWAPGCYAKGNITVTTCPTTNPAPGSCIPDGADVLAAFMYWEGLSTDPNAIPEARLGGVSVTRARRSDLPLPNQGSCLSSSGNPLTLSMFRADVLRFFPFQNDSTGKSTGKRQVIGTYQVALPEVGNGNNARQGAGASLFFVYRVPTDDLRKIVVYDGAYLQSQGAVMQQTLHGFYQSWDAKKSAWLTHVVGSGAKNQTERLKFTDAATATDVVVTDPFPFPLGGGGGNGSDRSWANPTYDVSNKMFQTTSLSGFGETASTAVDHLNGSPYECLTWAAVVFSTVVKDADHDGLPDGLEDATSGLKDPNPRDPLDAPVGRSLPNLNAMKADSSHKDVFIEMNGMWTRPADGTFLGTKYGHADFPFSTILGIPSVTDSVGHNHLPTPQALLLLGDALKDAPQSITAHFDVGNVTTYKGRPGYDSGIADKYLVCVHAADGSCTDPSPDARGGEIIEETNCDATKPGCHFPYFPGTVGWKFGFEHLRDQAVDEADGHELSPADADSCYEDGTYGTTACRRRFDPIRNGLFHYVLYAHALGIPKGKPCLDVSDPANKKDADFNAPGACALPLQNNPNFHVPRSTSGAGDAPGPNALITLGLWDLLNFVASPFIQASTSFHELGHNFDLSHGGKPPVFGNSLTATSFEPNCKPNYPSVMSYLFQVNGLLDLDGNARIDYSRGAYYDTANGTGIGNEVLRESLLHDGALALPDVSQAAAFRYRTAWYVPIIAPAGGAPGNLAYTLGVQEATRYCNGAKFGDTNPHMGRVDGPISGLLIDWNLDGSISTAGQDVNFDGAPTPGVFTGHNDWAALRLDQMGVGKNPGGFSLGQGGFEFGQGGFDFGQGGFDFGQGGFDYGQGGFEFGQGGFDFGQGGFDYGQGGFDYGDGGLVNFGQGGFDFGQGGFDFGQGGFDYGQGGFDYGNDVDFDLVKRLGATPPLAVRACVIQATGSCTVTPPPAPAPYPLHRHRITWNAPNVGTVSQYRIYRALGTTINGASVVMQVCDADPLTSFPVCPSGSTTSFVDTEELPYNQSFTYFVRAVFNNCNAAIEVCQSGPSNQATIAVTENAAPVAVNDGGAAFTTKRNKDLTLATLGVLANDTDPDSPSAPGTLRTVAVTVGPAHGSVTLNANGGLTYSPANGYTGTDTFSYSLNDGTWRTTGIAMSAVSANTGVVTITITK